MKFEVVYAGGARQEVELQGSSAVLGRDPSCDLVLNDAKCSRKHAVVEAGSQGLSIRDNGSANGIFVNGLKVERATLKEGDVVRLGETNLTVLPEDMIPTVVMESEELVDEDETTEDIERPDLALTALRPSPSAGAPAAPGSKGPPKPVHAPPPGSPPPPPVFTPPAPPPRPAARPPAASPAGPPVPARKPPPAASPSPPSPRAATLRNEVSQPPRPRGPLTRAAATPAPRPLTITVLAILWLIAGVAYGTSGLGIAMFGGWSGAPAALWGVAGVALALLSGIMGYGLWMRSPWARTLQLALAGIGVIVCPITLPSLALLVYMLRPETRAQFSETRGGAQPPGEAAGPGDGGSELAFTLSIVGSLLLGLAISAACVLAYRHFYGAAGSAGQEERAIARLRTLAARQAQFRDGTCNSSYADLQALLNPADAIPNYPPGGPPFVPAEFGQPEAEGYRFELRVEEPVPPEERCAARGFRRYEYSATPLSGTGRHFVVGPDGTVRAASGRPATVSDPPAQ